MDDEVEIVHTQGPGATFRLALPEASAGAG